MARLTYMSAAGLKVDAWTAPSRGYIESHERHAPLAIEVDEFDDSPMLKMPFLFDPVLDLFGSLDEADCSWRHARTRTYISNSQTGCGPSHSELHPEVFHMGIIVT